MEALKSAQSEFVLLCRELELFGGSQVAIDGSFLKANASQDSMYALKRLQRQLERLEAKIAAYLEQLDAARSAGSGERPRHSAGGSGAGGEAGMSAAS